MVSHSNQSKLFINRLLDPQAMIFGFAVLVFLTTLMYAIQYERDFSVVSDHWNGVRLMSEPLLLLLAAGALLFDKLWGDLLAIVVTGRVIYVLSYLGLVATSAAHEHSMFSWYVLRTWFVSTYAAQPQYLVELALAVVILGYGAIRCSRRMLCRADPM